MRLKLAFLKYGDNYELIAQCVDGRTKDALRNRVKHLKLLTDSNANGTFTKISQSSNHEDSAFDEINHKLKLETE